MDTRPNARIGVVIPSYKVTRHVLDVISRIGPEVARIYVVDDKCPDRSGEFVQSNCTDPRVVIINNTVNQGVGGAVLAGYAAGIADKMDVIVKVDGDGQMDPALIPQLVAPILEGQADYTKGNRFFSPESLTGMPAGRLIGNAGLSFLTKMSSGYWDILDPTNGYTAIHARVADVLPFKKIAKRYFFESDLLFRLNTVRAVVADIPMFSVYGEEESNFNAAKMLFPFLTKNIKNTWKRILYSYFLRGFSFASFCLVFGLLLLAFGASIGLTSWIANGMNGVATPTGTIMIVALSLILGFQLVLGFIAADIASTPTRPLQSVLNIQPAKALRPYADGTPKNAEVLKLDKQSVYPASDAHS
ncbi:MAG: glycosyltransferase family 2 protein [Verrucomicrobiaceae bacterium]|nr:MAG: glycosyltransferase family 2 protein [Verrucomicrobiaceae bacterium]